MKILVSSFEKLKETDRNRWRGKKSKKTPQKFGFSESSSEPRAIYVLLIFSWAIYQNNRNQFEQNNTNQFERTLDQIKIFGKKNFFSVNLKNPLFEETAKKAFSFFFRAVSTISYYNLKTKCW